MRTEEFLDKMISIAHKSGQMAIEFMEDSAPSLKPDQSVLTKADTAIAKYMKGELSCFLDLEEHLLIDEEDENNSRLFDQELLKRKTFIWSIDPIDGTRGYSNRMPTYGVSIGLLRNGRPWMGVVYLPTLGELFYCDGAQSYFCRSAFSPNEKKMLIQPIDQEITQQSVFLGSESLFKLFEWDYGLCPVMLPACAVIDLCWPVIGRSCGSILDAHIWDMAGSWPILRSAGLELRSLADGKILEEINVRIFQGKGSKTWRLKEHYILSSERNFPIIQKSIRLKTGM